jgi:hypothetical protein
MPTETRSPWTLTRDQFHPRRGESPGSQSSPSNARADWGHAAHTLGKSGHQPMSARRDAVPVVGGESAAPLQQALDRGMRDDRR